VRQILKFKPGKLGWLEYRTLAAYSHIVHGTFTRHGGSSQGAFSSLNLGGVTNDRDMAVKLNRELVQKAMGIAHTVYPVQSHGVNVHRITAKNRNQEACADALYTTERGVAIAVTHADCQAAIFYDPVHEAVAVAHSGWRGSVQNIYGRVVDTLKREIGTQAHNLLVCISPSLGLDHAEFKNYKQELPKEFWEYQKKPYHFDFWAISRMQLARSGILDKNIEVAEICTSCNTEDFFSYRKEGDTGRNATVVALRDC
jgi:YfiH family protein